MSERRPMASNKTRWAWSSRGRPVSLDCHAVPTPLYSRLPPGRHLIVRICTNGKLDIDTSTALRQLGLGVSGTLPLVHASPFQMYLAYRIPDYEGANPQRSLLRTVARNLDPLPDTPWWAWVVTP